MQQFSFRPQYYARDRATHLTAKSTAVLLAFSKLASLKFKPGHCGPKQASTDELPETKEAANKAASCRTVNSGRTYSGSPPRSWHHFGVPVSQAGGAMEGVATAASEWKRALKAGLDEMNIVPATPAARNNAKAMT